jgi:hypothetical protein
VNTLTLWIGHVRALIHKDEKEPVAWEALGATLRVFVPGPLPRQKVRLKAEAIDAA